MHDNYHHFLPILSTQTGITTMVGVRNAQKVPMFFRLIKLNEIFFSC